MIEEFSIGEYTLRPSYGNAPDKIEIAHASGEAGDFPVSELEAVIAAYYKANF